MDLSAGKKWVNKIKNKTSSLDFSKFKNKFKKDKEKPKISHKKVPKGTGKSLIGIDLFSSGIRVVEYSKVDDRFSITVLDKKDFFENIDQESPNIVKDNLGKYLSEINYTGQFVNAVIGNSDIKVEFKRLPYVDSKELEKIMEVEKERDDFDLEKEILDYAVLGEIEDESGKKLLIIIVSIPKAPALKLATLLENISLKLRYIEIAPLTLVRLLKFNKKLNSKSNYIIVNNDVDNVSVSLLKGDLFCLNRKFYSVGENVIVKAIAEGLEVDFVEAYKLKREFEFVVDKQYESDKEKKLFTVINSIFEREVIELERSIQYFINEYPTSNIEKIFLTGINLTKGLNKYLSESISLPVEIINPFEKLKEMPSKDSQDDSSHAYTYAIAAGLALREFIDED